MGVNVGAQRMEVKTPVRDCSTRRRGLLFFVLRFITSTLSCQDWSLAPMRCASSVATQKPP